MFLMSYVAVVITCGGVVLWASGMPSPAPEGLVVLFWLLANMLGEVLWLPAPRGRGYLSMATAANFASVLVLPVSVAMSVTALAGASIDLLCRRRQWYKVLFNAAVTCISVFAAAQILSRLGWERRSVEALLSPLQVGALALAAVAFFLLNTWAVSLAIALEQGCSAWGIWRTSFAFGCVLLGSFVLFLLGLFFATLFLTWGYMSAFVVTIATYFVRDAYCRYMATVDRQALGRAAMPAEATGEPASP